MRSIRSARHVNDGFNIVTGDEEQPPAANGTVAKAAIDNYRKRGALAAQLLTYTCTPNVQIHIRDLKDPNETWDTLLIGFDFTASEIGRPAILTKFLNTRPESGKKVREYIASLQTYQAQLHGTEQAISDGLLKIRIYDTIPSQFKTVIINLRHQPDITVERIIARLSLDEEERWNASSSAVALYARGNNSRGGRGQGGRNRGGRGRGGSGRGQSQGRNWNRSDGEQEQKTNAQSNS
jgi:hypothetical protein